VTSSRFAIWLVFALFALVHGRARAYSVNSTDDGDPIRWSVDSVGLRLDPALEAWLPPGDAFAAVSMAFDAWRGLPRVPDLVVKSGAPGKPGYHDGKRSNGVYLMKHWDYAPQKLAVTVVTFELETGRLLDADVLVNPDVEFRLLSEDGTTVARPEYDLAAVLTHEAGHVLGLGESEEDPSATMWPYANPGDVHQRTLSEDDEEGAIDAYAGPPPAPAAGCGSMRVSSGARHASGGAWLLLGLAGLGLWLRRWKRGVLVPGLCMGLTGLVLLPSPDAAPPPRSLVADDTGYAARIEAHAERDLAALRRFAGAAKQLELGKLERLEARIDDGFMRTRYAVRAADGSMRELSVVGGELNGIGQRVVGEPTPPRHGDEVAIAAQPDGKLRWAHHAGGRLRGGDLGEGTEIGMLPVD
jgi:hypothetical protein